jgi:hypothetical protein
MFARTRLFLLVLICAFSARSVCAQQAGLQVRVVASNGIPLSGALVALVDQQNVAIAEGLTGEAGTRTLSAGPGTYRVRVRRIGYQPFFSEAVTLPRSTELVVKVDDRKVVLSAMVIKANTQCGKFDKDNEQLALVWEEISKALLSSKLTSSDLENLARARIYRKQTNAGGIVVKSDTTYVSINDRAPFSAIDPAILARDGYVIGNPRKGWTYYGVDESILLSPAFSATHCFYLVKDKNNRPGQLGMAFEPVPGQKNADVRGILWVDEKASELRDIVFTFTNAGLLTKFLAGGSTQFRRLPSGAWIVQEWKLRAPNLIIMNQYMRGETVTVSGYSEDGGGVVVSSLANGRIVRTGVLQGVVFDSIAMRPISGATVTASGSVASTDADGRFAFTGIPLREQLVTFSSPDFSQRGFVALERELNLTRDTTDIVLATPSLKTMWLRICGDTTVKIRTRWSDTGILHGTVRDTLGNPVPNAPVKLYWTESMLKNGVMTDQANLTQQATTDANGYYAVCGFVGASHGTAFAVLDNIQTEPREFDFRQSLLLRRDLNFSSISSQVVPKVNEILVNVVGASGAPLSDVQVFMEGSSQVSRTDDAGNAVVKSAEKQAVLTVRRLGFSEQSLKISLGPTMRHKLKVTMSPVQTLPTVPVRADAILPVELERRRERIGTGSFFGREELDGVMSVKNLLSRVPRAIIDSNRGAQWRVYFRSPTGLGVCQAWLYVDGVVSPNLDELSSLAPEDVAAVEVYPHVVEAPQHLLAQPDACGVIMVWTRYWSETRKPLKQPGSDSTTKK